MNTFKSFDCTLDTVKQTLEERGVAVLPGIIPPDKCAELRDRAWEDFHRLIGLDQNDPSSYSRINDLYPLHSMLIQTFSLGHLQWIWDIRQDPSIVNAFSSIWETPPEELLTSFDGLSFHMPPEVTQKGFFEDSYWIHTDQSSSKRGLHCIQGSVNLYPVNVGDGTLCVLEGSHQFHESFFEDHKIDSKNDFFKIRDADHFYFKDRGCKEARVLAPEGSLTLWDSRTFHQGSLPFRERTDPNFRLVVYVCMTPRNFAKFGEVEKKRKAFNDLRMTAHWPHEIKLFSLKPRKSKVRIKPEDIGRPQLTELGMKLAGF